MTLRKFFTCSFFACLTGIALIFTGGPAYSQDEEAEKPKTDSPPATEEKAKPEIKAVTTGDAKIEPALLEAHLRPLTADEVQAELDGWLGLLKDKASEISKATVATVDLKDEALTKHQEKIVELKTQRAGIVERTRIVATELEGKGGDPASAHLYIDKVSAVAKPTGFDSLFALVKAWLTSEEGGVRFGLNLLKFFGCLAVGWLVGLLLSKILNKTLKALDKTSDLLRNFLVKMVRRMAVFVGLVIGISYLGVNIGPLMAAIGAAGLVIGLALQGTLSNFASGLLILFYEPFDVGDMVTAGGITGRVKSMTLVNTVFNTVDNQVVVVPNSKIWDDTITNVTASPNRRIDLVIGIGYDDDIDKAKTVLTEIVENHEGVLKNPEPQIAVCELGASSVDLVVRPWCRTGDYWNVRFGLTQTIKQRFDKEGISFPFPQQDVHMHAVERVESSSDEKK